MRIVKCFALVILMVYAIPTFTFANNLTQVDRASFDNRSLAQLVKYSEQATKLSKQNNSDKFKERQQKRPRIKRKQKMSETKNKVRLE